MSPAGGLVSGRKEAQMTKSNKTILITLRMNEQQVSELDSMLNRGETRSAGIRRILYNAWADMREAQEREAGYPSIDDRRNCL